MASNAPVNAAVVLEIRKAIAIYCCDKIYKLEGHW